MSNNLKKHITCNLRQVAAIMEDCLAADKILCILGQPGAGKSAVGDQVATDFNLELIDIRLTSYLPEDMNGFAHIHEQKDENGTVIHRVAEYVPFDTFPTVDTPLPEGKDGWLIILDEFPSADDDVKKACYKLLQERMIGQRKLHPNVRIILAGNRPEDGASAGGIDTALRSRVTTIIVHVDPDIWLEDWAIPHKLDPRVIGYIAQHPDELDGFDPKHAGVTFNAPRTWNNLSALIKGKSIDPKKMAMYAGTISEPSAIKFVSWCKVSADLPKIEDIIADPNGTSMPASTDALWHTVMMCIQHIDGGHFQEVAAYVTRMPLNQRILFGRSAIIRSPELRRLPEFTTFLADVSKHINGAAVVL